MKAKSTRKRHSSAFKAKVFLEALLGIPARDTRRFET
jgi:hypothetical protein